MAKDAKGKSGSKSDPKAKKGDKNAKKGKGKGKKGEDAGGEGGLSIATHPRAGASVRRARAAVALAAFAIAGWLSHRAGVSTSGTVERALIAGIAGGLLARMCAVAVWRYLLLAELRVVAERRATLNPARPTIPLVAAPAADAPPRTDG